MLERKLYKVFLAVGHGGSDRGACANGLQESALNLKQALFVEQFLVARGIEVRLSRRKEENDDVNEEVRESNAYNPDLSVALHTNSGGGNGFEVFHFQGTGTSYKLACNIDDEIKAKGYKSRGVKCRLNSKGGQYYAYIRNTNNPAIITEMAFIDNINDISNFDEDHEIKAYAECIAKGIVKTLGLKWTTVEAPPVSNETEVQNYNGIVFNVNTYLMVRNAPGSNVEIGKIFNNEKVKVLEVSGDYKRVKYDTSNGPLSKEGWVTGKYVKDLATITVGSQVKITGTNYATGQAISDWAKKQTHTVSKIENDKALLKEITSWCYLKDLVLA